MKHIVFVLGSYYPRYSAVGICVKRVVDALKGEFRISVVAMAAEHATEPVLRMDGINIHRISTPEIAVRSQLVRSLKAGGGRSDRLRLLALRMRGIMRRLLSRATVDHALVNAYQRKLSELQDADVIVPLVFPFETVIAALAHAATSKVKVVPYLFDNFVDSRSLHVLPVARELKRSRHLQLEQDMIERSAAVLSMHPLEAHFRKHFGASIDEKMHFLEHPLLIEAPAEPGAATDVVRLVYTGALIKNVREPDYVLDFLEGLQVTGPFEANFYVMGNASSQVKTGTAASGVVIKNHGQVSKQEASLAVEQSSILLNIGEKEGKQISSKIFEYMSAGKPVVHFSYTKDDIVTKILNRYPMALCLLQDGDAMVENRARFVQFVSENAGRTMRFEQVAEIFPEALPQTTAQVIAKIIQTAPSGGM